MAVAFRPADFSDRNPGSEWNFVVDSWVRSFQFAHTAGMIAMEDWFPVMIRQVEKLLERQDVQTIVAYEPGEKSKLADIQGFITFDTTGSLPVVFYVFVKETFRKWGYARGLFGAAGIDPERPFVYTCTTGVVSRIFHERKIPLAKWDPLIARFSKTDHRRPRRAR